MLDEVDGQGHAPVALTMGVIRYLLYREVSRLQGRSGRKRKISSLKGFDPRTVASRYTDYSNPAELFDHTYTYANSDLHKIHFALIIPKRRYYVGWERLYESWYSVGKTARLIFDCLY
jgi:hypothetical protein